VVHTTQRWDLQIVEREPGSHGSRFQQHWCVVERSFAWLCRHRRLTEVAITRMLLRRLALPWEAAPPRVIRN
jgi:hypothetical protein